MFGVWCLVFGVWVWCCCCLHLLLALGGLHAEDARGRDDVEAARPLRIMELAPVFHSKLLWRPVRIDTGHSKSDRMTEVGDRVMTRKSTCGLVELASVLHVWSRIAVLGFRSEGRGFSF